MRRLNGWRRLWVVGSGIALLGAIWWALDTAAKGRIYDFRVVQAFNRKECLHILRMPAGSKLDKEPEYGDPCWKLYSYRSIYKDAGSTEDEYLKHVNALQREDILMQATGALILWALGVALVYGMGVIVAWIVRGFRQPK
jgi:hypothetical protein